MDELKPMPKGYILWLCSRIDYAMGGREEVEKNGRE